MSDQTVILGELAEEFSARVRKGELPEINEYVEKYPQLSERIRDLFPTLMVLEGMATGTGKTIRTSTSFSRGSGDEFGSYQIESELGRGGMGVVYRAVHKALNKHVALKILVLGADPVSNNLERFLREARTAAKLHHTNIVPVFDVGQADGIAYYAMQLVEGTPLDVLLAENKTRGSKTISRDAETVAPNHEISTVECSADDNDSDLGVTEPPNQFATWQDYLKFVSNIGAQVADGLHYAHSNQVIHRDIKPSNLIIDHNDNVWITDFGLSRHIDDPSLTQTGMFIGTPRYMSPEQATAASKPVDHRTDIYSLGASLYELVAQRPPFNAGTPVEIVMAILDRQPVPLRKLNPHVPRDLETIIQKAMAKNVDDRYQSSDQLASDLRLWAAGETISARRPSVGERLVRWSRRNPRIAALLGAVAMLLATIAIGGVMFAIRSDQATRNANLLRSQADSARNDAQDRLLEAREHQAHSEINLSNLLLQQAKAEQLMAVDGYRRRALENIRQAREVVRDLDPKAVSRLKSTSDSKKLAVPSQVDLKSELLSCLQMVDLEERQRYRSIGTSVSANGKWLAYAGELRADGGVFPLHTLNIVNLANQKTTKVNVNSILFGLAVNSNGTQAAIYKGYSTIELIDTASGNLVLETKIPQKPGSSSAPMDPFMFKHVRFTEDDRFVVGEVGNAFAIWDLNSNKVFWIRTPNHGPRQFVYLAEEKQFLVSAKYGLKFGLNFHSAENGKLAKETVLKDVVLFGAIAVSNDAKQVAVVSVAADSQATLILFDLESKQEIASHQLGNQVPTALAFGPEGRRIAVGTAIGQLELFTVDNLDLITTCRVSEFGILDVVFGKSHDSIIVKSMGDVSSWQLVDATPVVHLESDSLSPAFTQVVVHPVTATLLRPDEGPSGLHWSGLPELSDGEIMPIKCADLLEVSHHAPICACSDGTAREDLQILNLVDKKVIKEWSHPKKSVIHSVGFDEDGNIFAIAGVRFTAEFDVYDVNTNEQVWKYKLPDNLRLQATTFSPDAKQIAIVGRRKAKKITDRPMSTIIVLEIGKSEPVIRWETNNPIQKVKFSNDSRLIYGIPSNVFWTVSRSLETTKPIDSSVVSLADLVTGKKEQLKVPALVVDVVLSSDGRWLAARDMNGLVRFWRLSNDPDASKADSQMASPIFNWSPTDRRATSTGDDPPVRKGELNLQVFFEPGGRYVYANRLMGGHYRLDMKKFDDELVHFGFGSILSAGK